MRAHRRVPLNESFRFIHEPLATTPQGADRFIGREAELTELASRILLSNGGAFLVTGYRGVGKTTFVNRVVQTVVDQLPRAERLIGPTEVVDVYLNFARPMRAVELMFHILRALHHRLADKGLLARIDAGIAQDLELAYARTTATVAYATSDTRERGLDVGDIGMRVPFLPSMVPALSFKQTRGRSRELSYLSYDEKSAEHDVMTIARRLTATSIVGAHSRTRWARLLSRRRPAARLKIIFVFDELDKIDEDRDTGKKSALDQVLNNLKNLFTTSGITFIFVAGKALHDRWLEDIGRGDSIYESVFTYARYLPVMWASSDQMCDPLVNEGAAAHVDGHQAAYGAFKKFLAFKGRGIPRRMIRGFNEYVRWDGGEPFLTFTPEDERQFHFYAGLYDLLVSQEGALLGRLHGATGSDRTDQRRLGLYYLTDWILQQGAGDFSLEDAVAASKKLNRMIAPSDAAAAEMVHALVLVLTEHKYLEPVTVKAATQAVRVGTHLDAKPSRYKVPRRRLVEMGSLSGVFEQEAEVLFAKQPSGIPSSRYQIQRLVGHGGMSSVYDATDLRTGRRVAIKQIAAGLSAVPEYRARLELESRMLAQLQHPNIVRLYDVDLEADPAYLVMEFVDGAVLTDLIRQSRLTDERVRLKLMHDLVGAVVYLHASGILWRDPKPANVIVTGEGRLVILDFGISRSIAPGETGGGLTQGVIGTPAYMSPEQVRGQAFDVRSDVYGLGVVFYEMVTGDVPFRADDAAALMMKHVNEPPRPPSGHAAVSPELEAVILRCLAKDPDDRYRSAAELLAALPAVTDSVTLATPAREEIQQQRLSAAREDEGTSALDPGSILGNTIAVPAPGTSAWSDYTVPGAFLAPQGQGGVPVIALTADEIGLGRSLDNDIVVDDIAASRYHLRLRKIDDRYQVEDLNSANGTFLNGRQLSEAVVLNEGDRISIGETSWVYHNARAGVSVGMPFAESPPPLTG